MYKFLRLCIVCILLFSVRVVSAEVYTRTEPVTEKNSIHVVGNVDFYPIEYYDTVNNKFDGVLPRLLKRISNNTGIDFTYFYDKDMKRMDIADAVDADLIASYTTKGSEIYNPNMITIFSYISDDSIFNIGWRYTKSMSQESLDRIKEEVSTITENEINALLIDITKKVYTNTAQAVVIPVITILLLILSILSLFIRISYLKKRMRIKEMTDSATGIGNLAYFEKQFISRSEDLNYIAYIIIDSNFLQLYHREMIFKDAIRYIADTLMSFVKEKEFAARITENGFAVVFSAKNDVDAKAYIEKLVNQISAYLGEKNVTPFFRMVAYNLKPSDRNCDILLFNLRKKCVELMSKQAVFKMCSEEMMSRAVQQKEFLENVLNGFKRKEFKLYLQFIVNNKTKQISSAEALSRWDRGEDGLLLPGRYIENMEKSGIIAKLDYYMFEAVCVQLHKWRDTRFEDISISCNFTRITLSEKNFIEKIEEISNSYVFDKSKLIIEITEDVIEKNKEVAINNILKCKMLGFKVALDDLGSGYTSLSNLCDYPVDIVKLDRSILLKTNTKSGQDLFAGIVALAHSLGLKVVCEGIENQEQSEYVTDSDCDFAQGWFYSKPMPISQSESFIVNFLKG